MYILNNGKLTRNKNIISIEDRGYLLGDAVFETILYKDKDLILFNLHLDRLISSLKLVKIKAVLDKRKLYQDILKLIKKNKLSNKTTVIRITISRVSNERGIDIHKKQGVCITVKSSELKNDLRLKPITLDISNIKRNEKSFISKIKSANYLENIIAKNDAIRAGYNDAIFTNNSGNVSSCTTSNIYFLQNNKFFTPPVSDGVLNGTIREFLIRKKKVAVRSIKIDKLLKCKEIFLSNSVYGIRPVTYIKKKLIAKNFDNTIKLNKFMLDKGI